MHRRRNSVVVLSIVVAFLAASSASAGLFRVYTGCYDCAGDGTGNTWCQNPSNNTWGAGSTCTEDTADGVTSCATSGGGCYYTEVGGGGGGSGSGGGGGWDNGCSTYAVGDCPADCASCGPFY